MWCRVYLDERVCKDSLPGGAGVAIHLCLSWPAQLATPPYPLLGLPNTAVTSSLMKGRFMYQIVEP